MFSLTGFIQFDFNFHWANTSGVSSGWLAAPLSSLSSARLGFGSNVNLYAFRPSPHIHCVLHLLSTVRKIQTHTLTNKTAVPLWLSTGRRQMGAWSLRVFLSCWAPRGLGGHVTLYLICSGSRMLCRCRLTLSLSCTIRSLCSAGNAHTDNVQ